MEEDGPTPAVSVVKHPPSLSWSEVAVIITAAASSVGLVAILIGLLMLLNQHIPLRGRRTRVKARLQAVDQVLDPTGAGRVGASERIPLWNSSTASRFGISSLHLVSEYISLRIWNAILARMRRAAIPITALQAFGIRH